MSENEIISILSKFSAEIILLAGLVSILTGIIKQYLPAKLKNLTHLIPFVLGIVVYACYSFLVLKTLNATTILKTGVQVGGLAILIYALIKQLSRKQSNAKNAVSDILKGFVDEASLNGVVTRIVKEYTLAKNSNVNPTKTITKIIAESSQVNEVESATLGSLIVKTLETIIPIEKTA